MNMNVREILENITKEHASDIFVVAGRPLTYKVSGKMHTYQEERMKPDMCRDFVTAIYELADHRDISQFETTGDDDFSFAIVGVSRFRVSTYKQRGSYSAVIRIITFTLPQPSELMIPDAVMELARHRSCWWWKINDISLPDRQDQHRAGSPYHHIGRSIRILAHP